MAEESETEIRIADVMARAGAMRVFDTRDEREPLAQAGCNFHR